MGPITGLLLLTSYLTGVAIVAVESDPPLKDLYIMGLYPMEGSWAGGHALLPATQLGLQHVNDRSDILPGYRLNLIWSDTKVSGNPWAVVWDE